MTKYLFFGVILGALITLMVALKGQTEEELNKVWGSAELYYEYCLDQLDSDDVDFLQTLADDDGIVYFRIYLDTGTIEIPTLVRDIFSDDELESLDL